MKLSKTSWFILITGVVLVTFASLGIAGAKQLQQKEKLSDELTVAERRVEQLQLEQLNLEREELKAQLEQLKAEGESARAGLRFTNKSIDVTDLVFGIAESTGVTLVNVASPGLSSDDLEGIPCDIQSLSASATGEVADLVAFVTRLNEDFATGMVESTEIAIPEEGGDPPSLQVRLTIYSYEE